MNSKHSLSSSLAQPPYCALKLDKKYFISKQKIVTFDQILLNEIFGWMYFSSSKKMQKNLVLENSAPILGADLGRSDLFFPAN